MVCYPARTVLFMSVAIGALLGGCEKASQREFRTVDRMTAGIFLEPEARAVLPAGMELRPVYGKGIELTKGSEGFVDHLYNDAAQYCTIAYGHLVKLASCDGTEPPAFLDGVTEDEGTDLLVEDISTAQVAVMTAVDVDLSDGQFAALCDFVFNVGSGNFRRSTLLKVVNAGDFQGVPFQLRRWVKAGGRELPGLVTRREKEIELFFDGLPVPRAVAPEGPEIAPIDVRMGEGI